MVGWFGSVMRYAQSGYLYHYAFAMILGLAVPAALAHLAPMMFSDHLLEILIWLPIVGGFVVLGLGDRAGCREMGLAGRFRCDVLAEPSAVERRSEPARRRCNSWSGHRGSRTIHSDFYIGVDGISMPLIVLTTFTTVLIVISSWQNVDKRVAQYFAAFLILEGLMIGVFAALDGVLFYVFWEAMLLPDVHHHRRSGAVRAAFTRPSSSSCTRSSARC